MRSLSILLVRALVVQCAEYDSYDDARDAEEDCDEVQIKEHPHAIHLLMLSVFNAPDPIVLILRRPQIVALQVIKYLVLAEDEVMHGDGRVFFAPRREGGAVLEALSIIGL